MTTTMMMMMMMMMIVMVMTGKVIRLTVLVNYSNDRFCDVQDITWAHKLYLRMDVKKTQLVACSSINCTFPAAT